MRIKLAIISSFIILFALSCTDSYVYNVSQHKLINNTWQINTYIDYSQNSTLDIIQALYIFEESGVLIKIYPNTDTVIAEWSMSADAKYLTLGSNTFKITELTKRVMSLRFGDAEMFFIAQD
ncbi:MAG: hypothetical protein PHW82_03995 [Bacteroidales bacterium]|nr:hypothetical protein [Bacteroidales bacterium]